MTDMRIGNPEREPVLGRLRDAFAHGYLDEEELDARISRVMDAKHAGTLAEVMHDLPAPPEPGIPSRQVLGRLALQAAPVLMILAGVCAMILTPMAIGMMNSGHGMGAGNVVGVTVAEILGFATLIAGCTWAAMDGAA